VAAKIFEERRERFFNCLLAFDFLMQKDKRILTDRRQEKRDKKQTQERQKKTSVTEFF
jgi:hypothetical protein